jgi:hypothetical protein
MNVLFLDESGDHSLSKIDQSYPIFVLSGVVIDSDYHDNQLTQLINEMKLKYFGTAEIVLHSQEMTHPQTSHNPSYKKFMDADFRHKFYKDFEKLLSVIEIKPMACIIMKSKQFAKYGLEGKDPYIISFDNLINRFVLQLTENGCGRIVAESRNSILDNQLEIAFLTTRIEGTSKLQPSEIKQKLENSITFRKKSDNDVGLQIADMLASPLARYHLGKLERKGSQIGYKTVFEQYQSRDVIIIPKK